MTHFPIEALPIEIQAIVIERVARNSLKDLYRLRVTCKSMRALTERRRVFRYLDVLEFPWRNSLPPNMLETCFAEENLSTLYLRGVQYFYNFDLKEEGLSYLMRSAKGGYERVMYTYGVTRKIFWDDDEELARLSRDFVERVGEVARGLQWGWGLQHTDLFLTKKYMFMASEVPVFYSCRCTPVEEIAWDLWHIENRKWGNMCNRCFWIKEIALSFRDFKPIHPCRDIRLW